MKKSIKSIAFALSLTLGTVGASAQMGNVMVGGAAMYSQKNIVENAINSKDHTTLVAAVKAAGLVEALMGKEPLTVFAPVNSAFANLPAGTVESLLKPENKAVLTKILLYHVVAGKLDGKELLSRIELGKGEAKLKTLSGGILTAKKNGEMNISIFDEKGGMSNISIYNVYQSNGVIHSIDSVLLPM
jgi:uncharacterized surface protein with fasciclin (FAS1) repeats